MTNRLQIGDTVLWRGGFGKDPARLARVTGLEVTPGPREKYGRPVQSITRREWQENRVVFTLDGRRWAYSRQVIWPALSSCDLGGDA